MLNNSFVMKDLRTFRNVWKVLNNPRLFKKYPQAINTLLTELMSVGSDAKPKLSSTVLKGFRKSFLNLSAVKDALDLLKV
jgi:electron transfer flavoprotein-quinone oxidoreductase